MLIYTGNPRDIIHFKVWEPYARCWEERQLVGYREFPL